MTDESTRHGASADLAISLDKQSVDRTLLRANLTLTPCQRTQKFSEFLRQREAG